MSSGSWKLRQSRATASRRTRAAPLRGPDVQAHAVAGHHLADHHVGELVRDHDGAVGTAVGRVLGDVAGVGSLDQRVPVVSHDDAFLVKVRLR